MFNAGITFTGLDKIFQD